MSPCPLYAGKVVIATPFYNLQALSTYTESLLHTIRVCDQMGIRASFMPLHGDSYVGRARNTLVSKFLEDPEATDLFFIDSDESWNVNGFLRVLFCPAEIVGGLYKMKNNWEEYCGKPKLAEDGTPLGYRIAADEALVRAEYLPCGFMKIRREVFTKMAAAYPQLRYGDIGSDPTKAGRQYHAFFECNTASGTYTGEDVAFCERWKEMGGLLWIEPRAEIIHYGISGYRGMYDEWLRENKAARATVEVKRD